MHQVPVGEVWTLNEIEVRKTLIEDAGMTWTVVESLPVSEAIKTQNGDFVLHIENYKQSLENLAAKGIKVITYNFMPVLDWLRTDVDFEMEDGSRALYFERLSFVAFDLFLLKRPGAEKDYSPAEIERATKHFENLTAAVKEKIYHNAMLGLPGSDEAFTASHLLAALQTYHAIDAAKLKEHLYYFLKQVVPVADACGLAMAIHPDDPPYAVLGLPRILSTGEDVRQMIEAVPSLANGLCFCTGSFGARPDNDIVEMLKEFGDRVHFLHLRNTKRDDGGNFYEADHLAGDTDMYAVIREILLLQKKRAISLPMRPDHGHQMLDDLGKKAYPGYSAIGRLKGLAELRGVEYALDRQLNGNA